MLTFLPTCGRADYIGELKYIGEQTSSSSGRTTNPTLVVLEIESRHTASSDDGIAPVDSPLQTTTGKLVAQFEPYLKGRHTHRKVLWDAADYQFLEDAQEK